MTSSDLKDNIGLLACGQRQGWYVFFASDNLNLKTDEIKFVHNDPRGQISHWVPDREFYSLEFTRTHKVFTKYKTIHDAGGRPHAYVGLFLFVPNQLEFHKGTLHVLDELFAQYDLAYIDKTKLKLSPNRENPQPFYDFLNQQDTISTKLKVQTRHYDPAQNDPHKGQFAYIRCNRDQLESFFCHPVQGAFQPYKEIFFVEHRVELEFYPHVVELASTPVPRYEIPLSLIDERSGSPLEHFTASINGRPLDKATSLVMVEEEEIRLNVKKTYYGDFSESFPVSKIDQVLNKAKGYYQIPVSRDRVSLNVKVINPDNQFLEEANVVLIGEHGFEAKPTSFRKGSYLFRGIRPTEGPLEVRIIKDGYDEKREKVVLLESKEMTVHVTRKFIPQPQHKPTSHTLKDVPKEDITIELKIFDSRNERNAVSFSKDDVLYINGNKDKKKRIFSWKKDLLERESLNIIIEAQGYSRFELDWAVDPTQGGKIQSISIPLTPEKPVGGIKKSLGKFERIPPLSLLLGGSLIVGVVLLMYLLFTIMGNNTFSDSEQQQIIADWDGQVLNYEFVDPVALQAIFKTRDSLMALNPDPAKIPLVHSPQLKQSQEEFKQTIRQEANDYLNDRDNMPAQRRLLLEDLVNGAYNKDNLADMEEVYQQKIQTVQKGIQAHIRSKRWSNFQSSVKALKDQMAQQAKAQEAADKQKAIEEERQRKAQANRSREQKLEEERAWIRKTAVGTWIFKKSTDYIENKIEQRLLNRELGFSNKENAKYIKVYQAIREVTNLEYRMRTYNESKAFQDLEKYATQNPGNLLSGDQIIWIKRKIGLL